MPRSDCQVRYPGKLYAEADRALIPKFPNLADSAGTGYAAAMEDGEDKETIDAHLVAMAKEVSKARPDVSYISDCMARTFASRIKWIGENPSVADIVKEYPALSMSTIARLEFQRMTDVAVLKKLEEVLGPSAKKIIMVSRKKRHLQSFLQSFDESISGASEASQYGFPGIRNGAKGGLRQSIIQKYFGSYAPSTSSSSTLTELRLA
ncbi:hypothetical protein HPB49_020935 [Dermacentor silvarum]|uniref:Uncharacterized protein n=1 Tax=Dermacentor silvarum TaxID=543639 RepID=A0ACB8CZW9_DERSI|nr:hypothetical protein HPB49_020935 [Dermacentor silvarum]